MKQDAWVDLHLHTNFSDGILTPTQIVMKAKELSLRAIGIVDHDTIDGISEAMNDRDEEFDEKRIEEFVRANLTASAEDMKERLYTAVKNFTAGVPQSDDITMIVVKVL